MAIQQEKLESFSKIIIEDAKKECDVILKQVEQERKRALSEAEDEILTEIYRFIKQEVARIKINTGRKISRQALENKRALYQKRDQVAHDVADELLKRLAAYVASPRYEERLKEMVLKAQEKFGEEPIRVLLRAEDMRFSDALTQTPGAGAVSVHQSGEIRLGGLIAECPDRGLRADMSFDSALLEQKAHFLELFGLSIASK